MATPGFFEALGVVLILASCSASKRSRWWPAAWCSASVRRQPPAQGMRSLLYGVAPSDPASLAAAAAFVAVVAAIAIAITVARAIHIEPATALRQEN